jgi:hypothetical protein
MADLDQFIVRTFDQGEILRREFALKKDAQEGICWALVVEYCRISMGGEGDWDKIAAKLKDAMDKAINRQAISSECVKAAKDAVTGSYDFLQVWNKQSSLTGVTFSFENSGNISDPLRTALNVKADGWYALRFDATTASGSYGHIIAIEVCAGGTSYVMFDPNIGLLMFSKAKLGEAVTGYWTKYRSDFLMTIGSWWLLKMAKTQTLFEKFEAMSKGG